MARTVLQVGADAQPDIESWVWSVVGPLNPAKGSPGPRHASQSYANTPAEPLWLRSEGVQLDCRGATKQATRAAAWEALWAVLALEGQTLSDGVCTSVVVVAAPFWSPEPSGQPRYVSRVSITGRPLSEPQGS